MTTIKNKQLDFTHNQTSFNVQITYDTSLFSEGEPSFWQTELYQVNGERLLIPITYKYIQSRGWLLQIPKYRNHSYICSSRRKEFENQTNLYPLAKEQVIYQWFNRKIIFRYKAQINNFNFLVKRKYQHKLALLKEQRRELKQKLRHNVIDNIQYQKSYTPILKLIDEIEFHIWDICRKYNDRYFDSDRLKEIYKVD